MVAKTSSSRMAFIFTSALRTKFSRRSLITRELVALQALVPVFVEEAPAWGVVVVHEALAVVQGWEVVPVVLAGGLVDVPVDVPAVLVPGPVVSARVIKRSMPALKLLDSGSMYNSLGRPSRNPKAQ
jgi:hypothetical protein